jgi:flagellar biosynthetic protein FliP
MKRKAAFIACVLVLSLGGVALAAEPLALPSISVGVGKVTKPADVSVVLQILFLMTVITLAPGLLIMTTSFTRIVVVLSFLRNAMGTQQSPSNQIVIGLSLFLTFFIMGPVWQQIDRDALQPYKSQTITQEEALKRAVAPVRKFMFSQTREKDLSLFVSISKLPRPKNS